MKNYTRKTISAQEIDAYSSCTKYYELSKDAITTADENDDDIFRKCLQEAVTQMYVMQLATGNRAEFGSVQAFWSKAFWKAFSSDALAIKALEYSERGLDILHRYHSTVYSMSNNKIVACRAPYSYTLHCEKIEVPVEMDLISVNKENNEVYLTVFTDEESVSAIKESMTSSAKHMVQLSSIKKEIPQNHIGKATFYNIEKEIGYTMEITDETVKEIDRRIGYLVQGIHNKVFFKSKTSACENCPCFEKCSKG